MRLEITRRKHRGWVASRAVADMHMRGFRLHALKGELKGLWAVTVRANWRVIFRLSDPDAFDVDYVDYH
jgi:proteic killer suppression protein